MHYRKYSCLKIVTYFKLRLRQILQIIFSKLLLLLTNFYFSYELLSCTQNSRIILNIYSVYIYIYRETINFTILNLPIIHKHDISLFI